ncbi:hypothetical protein GSH00_27390, partial [Burkholderia pseudomallei]|nr:hypothetical protein [Burkholderia pseudomallei]
MALGRRGGTADGRRFDARIMKGRRRRRGVGPRGGGPVNAGPPPAGRRHGRPGAPHTQARGGGREA